MADQGRHTYEAIEAHLMGCIYSAAPSAEPLKEVRDRNGQADVDVGM